MAVKTLTIEALSNLLSRHWAITDEVIGISVVDPANYRPRNLFRCITVLVFYAVSSIVARTALDYLNAGIGHQ